MWFALSACTTIEDYVGQFDVVTGLAGGVEPAAIDYTGNVAVWSRRLEAAGSEIEVAAYENPSGFAREALLGMVVLARDDFDWIAEIAPRLLFVAHVDDNTLNRIEALEGISDFLFDLGVDPLRVRVGEPRTAATRSALFERLAEIDASKRSASLSDTDRATIAELLREVVETPMDTHTADRELLRLLTRLWRRETDGRVESELRTALAGAIRNAGGRAAAVALRSPDARIRAVAANLYHRLSGAAAVPFVLQRLSRTGGARFEYSSLASERRMLLRMCASLSGEDLYASHDDGPRPIDFIYDTVARDEDEGLRFIALETMARCLGRPISFDPSWADAWWREFSLRDGDR